VSLIPVLDDRATERDLLSTVLTYAGHTIVQASTGEEALDLTRANRPELIMADLMMPGMNGYEFVRELRADPALEDARVVFCTATYDQDEVRRVAESCCVLHTLVKPCEPEEIIRVVNEVLGSDQELASGILGTIATDAGRLRQALKNLIAHAFKFTEQGEVKVRVSRPDKGWSPSNHELAPEGKVIAFNISDTGIGIEAKSRQHIFEAFAQSDETTARHYGGIGLGLSISRQLVELLGGEMALTSTLGEGSTFAVHLPCARHCDPRTAITSAPDIPDLQPRSTPAGALLALQPVRLAVKAPATRPSPPPMLPAAAGLAGKTVLVVDDDFRNIFAITVLLERPRSRSSRLRAAKRVSRSSGGHRTSTACWWTS
jgi:CheY-like chemotaxis protein